MVAFRGPEGWDGLGERGWGEVGAIWLGAPGAASLPSTAEGMRPELQPRPVPAGQGLSDWHRAHLVLQMGGPAPPGPAAIPRMNGGAERPRRSSAS